MSTVISRSSQHKMHWPGMHSFFGGSYKEEKQLWKQFFTVRKSKMAHEEIAELFNFGLASKKEEGGPVTYDTVGTGKVSRFVHCTWALAYVITEEAMEDNLYSKYGNRYSSALGRSMRVTKEIVSHMVLNSAFDPTVPGGDGKPLISGDHPSVSGMPQSNILEIASDISEIAIEDMLMRIDLMTDQRGLPINLSAKCLVVPVQARFEASRILRSTLQSYSDGNNINVLKAEGLIPKVASSRYLLDPDAFFILTDAEDGLIMFQRIAVSYGLKDQDFNTGNNQYRARERYSVGYGDWRCIIGSPGA